MVGGIILKSYLSLVRNHKSLSNKYMITNFDVIDDIDSYRNTALKNKKNNKVNLP